MFLYSEPEDLTIDFNSACAITGKVLEYKRKRVKKNPNVPKKIPISTNGNPVTEKHIAKIFRIISFYVYIYIYIYIYIFLIVYL